MAFEWTDKSGYTWTYRSFMDKMEWEDGIAGLINYGGGSIFPPEIRDEATEIERCLGVIEARCDEIEALLEAEDSSE